MNRVFTGVIDDTMNDGEVLVVAIASGFTKYNKLFLQIDGKAEDRYQKFFEEMATMFTDPGLIELTDEELLPFKELTGSVYMGEAEAAGGNATVNATKQAISMSYWFEDAKEVLVHILGSSEIVDTSTASEAVSVIREVAKESNCIFGVHVDDSMGKIVCITVVAKIP